MIFVMMTMYFNYEGTREWGSRLKNNSESSIDNFESTFWHLNPLRGHSRSFPFLKRLFYFKLKENLHKFSLQEGRARLHDFCLALNKLKI